LIFQLASDIAFSWKVRITQLYLGHIGDGDISRQVGIPAGSLQGPFPE